MPMDFPKLTTGLKGDMDMLACQDMDGDPNSVLEIDRDWYVQPHWYVDGDAAPFLGGTWHIQIKVESIAGGDEKIVARLDLPVGATGPGPLTHALEYRPWIRVPGLDSHEPDAIQVEGVYMVVAVLTYTTPNNRVGRIAGFHEGTLLQFYHFTVPTV